MVITERQQIRDVLFQALLDLPEAPTPPDAPFAFVPPPSNPFTTNSEVSTTTTTTATATATASTTTVATPTTATISSEITATTTLTATTTTTTTATVSPDESGMYTDFADLRVANYITDKFDFKFSIFDGSGKTSKDRGQPSSRVSKLGELEQYVLATVSNIDKLDPLISFMIMMVMLFDLIQVYEWWRNNTQNFPHMSRLARKFLAVPATSTPAERTFSKTGFVTDKRRQWIKLFLLLVTSLLHNKFNTILHITFNNVCRQ